MTTRQPRLLDLYCGAGGAAMGYHRAGFEVVGVDLAEQRRYPFGFVRGNVLDVLADPYFVGGFDALHASPPCQDHSYGAQRTHGTGWLLGATRDLLARCRQVWVIENVPGAPMRPDWWLCGCNFGLPGLRRERWFENSAGRTFEELRAPCHHPLPTVTVVSHGPPTHSYYYPRVRSAEWETIRRRAMGIDWMTRDEIGQAIPPAYTEWIGGRLMEML